MQTVWLILLCTVCQAQSSNKVSKATSAAQMSPTHTCCRLHPLGFCETGLDRHRSMVELKYATTHSGAQCVMMTVVQLSVTCGVCVFQWCYSKAIDCWYPFSSCRYHLIIGAGYATAEQVNVALSRPLTVVFTGSCRICAPAKQEDQFIMFS